MLCVKLAAYGTADEKGENNGFVDGMRQLVQIKAYCPRGMNHFGG